MCGIIGYIGGKNTLPILFDGLQRLEYRGYDSAGVALIRKGKLEVHKKAGKVADLVLIQGDLRSAPTVIQNVAIVFKDGVGYDSPKLIAATKGRVGID